MRHGIQEKGRSLRRKIVFTLLIGMTASISIGLLHTQRSVHMLPPAQSLCAETKQNQTNPATKETWIVVFVHGIMSVKPHLTTANFLRFMSDKIEHTTYSKTVELMRDDPVFCENQAMQGLGLQQIDLTDTTKGNTSSALANILQKITHHCYPHKTIDARYYTFGWSALLSPKQRYIDAKKLFCALEQERERFKQQGITPKIKVIGYSHGGNVVLNLGAVHERDFPTSTLSIDETLLIGMPVQKETDDLINDPIFKKIYHIFSNADRIQKLDFFSFNRFFSRQLFKERGKRIRLPKKLVQIQIKLTRSTQKTRSIPQRFAQTFNMHNPTIRSGKSSLLRESSPGHAELWFFGWSPQHYRPTFAFHPLPTIALAPFLMQTLEDVEDKTKPTLPVVIDVRPEQGVALIKNVGGKNKYVVKKFIPPETFQELRKIAFSYQPENYSAQNYTDHIYKAFVTAKKYYQEHWSKTPHRVRRRKKLAKLHAAAQNNTVHENGTVC